MVPDVTAKIRLGPDANTIAYGIRIYDVMTYDVMTYDVRTYMGHRDQDGKKVDEMSLFF